VEARVYRFNPVRCLTYRPARKGGKSLPRQEEEGEEERERESERARERPDTQDATRDRHTPR
jgi:hypothetical protein